MLSNCANFRIFAALYKHVVVFFLNIFFYINRLNGKTVLRLTWEFTSRELEQQRQFSEKTLHSIARVENRWPLLISRKINYVVCWKQRPWEMIIKIFENYKHVKIWQSNSWFLHGDTQLKSQLNLWLLMTFSSLTPTFYALVETNPFFNQI